MLLERGNFQNNYLLMKKLLAIVVLGLLWSNSGYSYVMQDLIETLEETKKPKSIEVAETLKSINAKEKSYDLIIRKANLNLEDAKNIANAISRVEKNNGPKLHTLSMSFNQELKDEGVIAILNQIPKTTSVIAFVECGITDKAGQAIIDWAAKTNNLDGIYIEGNTFSKSMETKFAKLRTDNPQLTVLSEWASEEFKEMVKKSFN
jgi:thioesterase domain-containing protein